MRRTRVSLLPKLINLDWLKAKQKLSCYSEQNETVIDKMHKCACQMSTCIIVQSTSVKGRHCQDLWVEAISDMLLMITCKTRKLIVSNGGTKGAEKAAPFPLVILLILYKISRLNVLGSNSWIVTIMVT